MLRGFVGFFAVGLAIVADRGLGLGPDRGKMGTDLSPLLGRGRRSMRCYFLRDEKIEAVELLKTGPDDELIEQARKLFREKASLAYDSFEVWDLNRFVHRERGTSSPR